MEHLLDIANHLGLAAAIYVAIRADLRHLMSSTQDHEKRIRFLERAHHG